MKTLKDKIIRIIVDTDFNLGETAEHSANRILELIDCEVMLREKIWEHARQHYGAYPNWLIMTGSFYEKLIYELSNKAPHYAKDLMELHKFEDIKIAVIPRTYGAELTVETAT